MFRSSIKKSNHIWACLKGCIFSCPVLTFLDSPWHYCWSPLPLRLRGRQLETTDKKDPCGGAAWEQWPQAGRLELSCSGKTAVIRCCSEELLPREKPQMGSLCTSRAGPVLSMQRKCELSSTDPDGIYMEDDEPGNRWKITDCRNCFPGRICRDFIFFVWKMLGLCKSLSTVKKTTLWTTLLKWRKINLNLEK